MWSNIVDAKSIAKRATWLGCRVALPLLLALLSLGFVTTSTGHASPSAPLLPAAVSSQRADSAPVMEEFNGVLYIGWTGRNGAHNLNLMAYNPSTSSFSAAQVLTDTTIVGAGPSLSNFYNNLYVAWLGTDHRLNVGRYNMANPSVLANKVTLDEHSTNAPALTGFNGRLYLSWRGTDGRLNLMSSVDGSTFGSKITYIAALKTSPSLVSANMYMLVFWEEMNVNSNIVVGRYDPQNPMNLNPLVTLASTSQLPVGVAQAGVPEPYARIAWRTGSDAHIRLGLYESSSFIHNPVYTTQTTPYTPTLFNGAYLCWTGTDAAQSVNVASIHL
ncbi:hypothetical protein [Dictyobacter kobayashii]|uniref:Uncharacterized protein n=1 Tax=Dictyobacter kobayashii TaxID=2014872 RepID=A0A402AQK3_9CHLR|nr:hypothetical protein [Dictyobacter kobayashii]GCE21382.1 hypothetical protein KDK_51820 [Dictyobacter kobayashii]